MSWLACRKKRLCIGLDVLRSSSKGDFDLVKVLGRVGWKLDFFGFLVTKHEYDMLIADI